MDQILGKTYLMRIPWFDGEVGHERNVQRVRLSWRRDEGDIAIDGNIFSKPVQEA